MAQVPIFTGLSQLADRYDGLIVDLWGVLHDGVTAFPEALDCLAQARRHGKRVVILSNAPRRIEAVVARNRELGIETHHYDAVMSSGEEAWMHLKGRCDDWYRALGQRCLHFGPERDLGIREGLDYEFVADVADADFLLNTGAHRPEDTAETFRPLLEAARGRGLPMVCANPDLVVIRGGRREICAGTIAQAYEALGGQVRYHGKPHRQVFETCIALMGSPERWRIANIGDSLRTDVAGANAAGIDAIFVTSGIHGEELGVTDGVAPDPDRLAAHCAAANQMPRAALPLLRW